MRMCRHHHSSFAAFLARTYLRRAACVCIGVRAGSNNNFVKKHANIFCSAFHLFFFTRHFFFFFSCHVAQLEFRFGSVSQPTFAVLPNPSLALLHSFFLLKGTISNDIGLATAFCLLKFEVPSQNTTKAFSETLSWPFCFL